MHQRSVVGRSVADRRVPGLVGLWHKERFHSHCCSRHQEVRPEDRLVRRPHRPERQPRHQHPERRQARRRRVQREEPRLQGHPRELRLAGRPDQAPALAKKAIDDETVVGIVGPAFSGESEAADPVFDEAGLATITPSATNPDLSTNGWKTFHRVARQRRHAGPGRGQVHQGHAQGAEGLRHRRRVRVRQGPGRHRPKDLGSTVVGNDTIQQKQTDFGASVTKVKASGADALFFGGYYPEAAPLVKQLRDAGWKGTFVVGDGVRTRLRRGRQGRRRGHDHHLPVRPADVEPSFGPRTRRSSTRTRAPTRVRPTTPRRSSSTASRTARPTRDDGRVRGDLRRAGRHQAASSSTRRARSPRSRSSPTRSRAARSSPPGDQVGNHRHCGGGRSIGSGRAAC